MKELAITSDGCLKYYGSMGKAQHAFKARILVTGGAGFIGAVLVPELLKEGYEVTVLDNLTWGMQGISANLGKPGFYFVKGDIRDNKLISHIVAKNDVVVHLAALVGEQLCKSNFTDAINVNVNGSRNIEYQLSDDQLLVYASTGSVYGQANGLNCSEKHVLDPQSHYARTKVEAEKVFARRKNSIILRFATAFGVSSRKRLDLLVNQFVYEAVKHKTLEVYGKNIVRSVVSVHDIARSIVFAIQNRSSMEGQIFNVSSAEVTTKEQIAQRIRKQVCFDLRFAKSNFDLDKRNYHLNTRKIEQLGYRTQVSLDQGIVELIHAIKKLKVDETCFNTLVVPSLLM